MGSLIGLTSISGSGSPVLSVGKVDSPITSSIDDVRLESKPLDSDASGSHYAVMT
jgi:hypothetical protein